MYGGITDVTQLQGVLNTKEYALATSQVQMVHIADGLRLVAELYHQLGQILLLLVDCHLLGKEIV